MEMHKRWSEVYEIFFLQLGKFHCTSKLRVSLCGPSDRAKLSFKRSSFFEHLMLNQIYLSQHYGDLVI